MAEETAIFAGVSLGKENSFFVMAGLTPLFSFLLAAGFFHDLIKWKVGAVVGDFTGPLCTGDGDNKKENYAYEGNEEPIFSGDTHRNPQGIIP